MLKCRRLEVNVEITDPFVENELGFRTFEFVLRLHRM